jgi:integrase
LKGAIAMAMQEEEVENNSKRNKVSEDKLKIASENDIPRNLVYLRMRKGWTLEDAITRSPGTFRNPKNVKIVLTDDQYKAAEENGINHSTFYNRVRAGWSIEDAITKPVGWQRKSTNKFITREQRKKAYENGIRKSTLRARVSSGWSIEDAINKPLGWKLDGTNITEEQYKIAKENGIKRSTVNARVRALKWSVENAITKPPYIMRDLPDVPSIIPKSIAKTSNGQFVRVDPRVLRAKVRQMRFWEYFAWFTQNEKFGKIRPVTMQKYDACIKWINKLAPEMLLVDLEINRKNMQWLIDKFGETHQKQTTLDFKSHITTALDFAVEDGYIRSFAKKSIVINSVEKSWSAEKQAEEKNKIKTFSATEFNRFKFYLEFKLHEILEKEPLFLNKKVNIPKQTEQNCLMVFAVAINTGARFAEILGFKNEDIIDSGIVINKSYNYKTLEKETYLPTKNQSSIRTAVIGDTLRNLLDRYWRFKKKYGLHEEGSPLLIEPGINTYNSTTNQRLKRLEKELGLPLISFHKLRHSYVSYLIDKNISEAVIAKQVGHATTDMIHRVYGHLLKEREARETAAIKGFMG